MDMRRHARRRGEKTTIEKKKERFMSHTAQLQQIFLFSQTRRNQWQVKRENKL